MTVAIPTARSPLIGQHLERATRLEVIDGWQLPLVYSSAEHESEVVRKAVGLADLSAFTKLSLRRGPAIGSLTAGLGADSSISKPRQVSWFEVEGHCLACRLTDDHLLMLATSTGDAGLKKYVSNLARETALVEHEVTSAFAGLCLVGPHATRTLQPLSSFDLSDRSLLAGTCAETNVAGIHTLLIRPPRVELDAIWLYVTWDLGQYLWTTVKIAGEKVGLEPIGLTTWQALLPR